MKINQLRKSHSRFVSSLATPRLLLFSLAALGGFHAAAQTSVPVTVSINAAAAQAAVPAGFQGLSFEIRGIAPDDHGTYYYDAQNLSLVTLLKTMGVTNLRYGGTMLDEPGYTPSHADIDHIFGFAKAVGAKVIYSLRLKTAPGEDKQKQYQTEAADVPYIMGKYADLVDCFCLGNEPNVYYKSVNDFLPDWRQFTDVINSVCPEAKFCGPGAWAQSWIVPFARQFARDPHLAYVTEHIYKGQSLKYRLPRDSQAKPAAGQSPSFGWQQAPKTPEEQKLLADLQAKARAEMLWRMDYTSFFDAFGPALKELGLNYRIEETNSFNHGGVPNASNAYSASLWGLNFEWFWASHGAEGVNLHTGAMRTGARFFTNYSAFETAPGGGQTPLGLAYAMLTFKLGSTGTVVESKLDKGASPIHLTSYAVAAADHAIYVTLINQDFGPAGSAAAVHLQIPGSSIAHVQTMALSQSSGDVSFRPGSGTPGAITVGGASIDSTGAWSGKWSPATAPRDSHTVDLAVPAASALVVKLSS